MRYIRTSIVTTLVLAGTTLAATINVPGDYATIQGAVNAAANGDEVVVEPGTYTDTQDGHVVDMKGKSILLRSLGGPSVTFIDGENVRRGIACYTNETADCRIEGFTIQNGYAVTFEGYDTVDKAWWKSSGGGVLLLSVSPVFYNCVIQNCSSDVNGGGMMRRYGRPLIENCRFVGNEAIKDGGGIASFEQDATGDAIYKDCVIEENQSSDGTPGGGGIICGRSTDRLEGCLVRNNLGRGGVLSYDTAGWPVLADCVVCGNEGGQVIDNWTNENNSTIVSNHCSGPIVVAQDGSGDFTTIQAAIDAAINFDTIQVEPGVYTASEESPDVARFNGKEIQLIAMGPVGETVIDGQDLTRGMVWFNEQSPWSQIDGFTVRNCVTVDYDYDQDNVADSWENNGAGITCYYSSPTIKNCVVVNNYASPDHGAGIYTNHSLSLIENCVITNNEAAQQGGGVSLDYFEGLVIDCAVVANIAPEGGGIYCIGGSPAIMDTSLCGNEANHIQGSYFGQGNTFADDCDVDSDGDGVPNLVDNCDLYNPDQEDCNNNGVGDVCDVADQTSYDCNQNVIPDECESDCDGDGVIDDCDNDPDSDGNGIPDNCETDCNGNTIPDHFEIEQGWTPDCNGNGVPDECDLWDSAYDCDDNGAIDFCEIIKNPDLDCNMNGVIDSCDLAKDPSPDCDGNGLFDSCEIEADPDLDCDGSGVLDTCELVYWYAMRAKPLASDGETGDNFGYGIGVEGDVALVSARFDADNGEQSGSVYVFERQLDGQWSETGKFSGSDTTAGDTFGVGVSLDGSRAAISASGVDAQGGDRTGSVYIFEREPGGAWIEVDQINAPSGLVDAAFGDDVSLEGDRLMIGATLDDETANNAGSAFIYERNADGDWTQQAKLLASDGDGWHYFGVGVALSGDRAMVGAPKYNGDIGVVYVFERQKNGSWIETGKIGASDGTNGDVYGGSIALEGNRLFVNSSREQGFLYVYDRDSAGEWIEVDILPGPDTGDNEGFGYDVALDGNQLLAGAHGDSNENGEGAGSFYNFQRTSKLDCDANGVVDSCEIADDPSLDCDSDGILDSCAFAEGLVEDCDQDGLIDTCEIADDPLLDQNNNGLLDQCECLADIAGGGEPGDGDGVVDVNDVLAIIGFWGSAGPIGDINFDGVVDVNDLLFILNAWGPCP